MRSAIVWPWLVTSCLVGVGGGTLFAQTPSRQAGELSYGESPGLGSLNPYGSINRSGPTDRLLSMIYEPLFRFNFLAGEGAWENVLATGIASVKPTKGRSAFAVELRQGVEWHDGKPFTATDVISTYFDYLRFLAANARQLGPQPRRRPDGDRAAGAEQGP